MTDNNYVDILSLEGLIQDDLALYNRIMSAYFSEMANISSFSNIYCGILFDKIQMKNSNNCILNLSNQCFANSYLSLNVFLKVLIDNTKYIPANIKRRLEKNLGILLDNDIDQNESGFIKRCNISAQVNNNIKIKNLIINGCESQLPLTFNFFNTGDAKANCGIVELLNALSNKTEDETDNDDMLYLKFDFFLSKVLGLNYNDLFMIICLFVSILIVIIISKYTISNWQTIIFKFVHFFDAIF